MSRSFFGAAVAVALSLSASTAIAGGLAVPPSVAAHGKENDPFVLAGYLDAQALYGADPSGMTDSTAAIQSAMDDAIKYAMIAYLPKGKYKVHDTLLGRQAYNLTSCGSLTKIGTPNSFVQAPSLVGPAHGDRPVIILDDGAPGFADPQNPKPIIHFWNDNPTCTDKGCHTWMGNSDCLVNSVLRDVDVVVGKNPGAVGVQFASAQYSYMENISVDATGGYAGIEGVPTTGVAVNLEVTGGKYGMIPTVGFGTLVGITLTNQTDVGLQIDGFAATTVTGFNIKEETGAIPISNEFFTYQGSQDVLMDGQITMSGGSATAISNPKGHDLYVRNVYVTTASGALIESGTNTPIPASGGGKTDLIREYSYTNATPMTQAGLTTTSYNLIDGAKGQNALKTIDADSQPPPADLLSRHLPGPLPWFEDPGVKDVTSEGAVGDGQTDSTAAIQKAIDESDYVFLPRGDYALSGTLKLRPNTHLFGAPGPLSRLYAPAWDPHGTSQPYIQTADTATGETYVADLFLMLPNGLAESYLEGIDWRAGRSSVMRQVAIMLPWLSQGPYTSAPRTLIHAEGNGGGKWYTPQISQTGHSSLEGSGIYGVLVDGTTAPLTIYGENPEHEQSANFVTVSKASNVRFLGSKSESISYAISHSNNVMFAGHTANQDDQPSMQVEDSTNVIIPVFSEYGGQGHTNSTIVAEVVNGTTTGSIAGNDRCSLFERGSFDDAPFPKCGDGTCDGAETAETCPSDCGSTSSGAGGAGGSASTAGVGGGASSGSTGANAAQSPGGTRDGGCSCSTSGAGESPMSTMLWMLGLGLLVGRKRRTSWYSRVA